MFERDKVGIFRELVHNYQDAIIGVGYRQTFNEIEANHLPCIIWYREWLKKARIFNSFILCMLTDCAMGDKMLHHCLEIWPSKKISHSLVGGWKPRVSPKWTRM
jgi:hypothetical protein